MLIDTPTKYQEVLSAAQKIYQTKPDWVSFFRSVQGIDGIIRQAFPEAAALKQFEQGEEFAEIQRMLAKLRAKSNGTPPPDGESTRVITVRLPKSLHETLQAEAHEHQISMNKYCISKLLQIIDQQLVPNKS